MYTPLKIGSCCENIVPHVNAQQRALTTEETQESDGQEAQYCERQLSFFPRNTTIPQ